MSTHHLTIHDLLRITYTYEAQALEEQGEEEEGARMRPVPICSVRKKHYADFFLFYSGYLSIHLFIHALIYFSFISEKNKQKEIN